MNILILNGSFENERGATARRLKDAVSREATARGWNVTAFDLDSMTIKPCSGCFACWLKHPGACAIKDDAEAVLKAHIESDVLAWITPITFGGYSSALKKALDRLIPSVLPFFHKVHDEIHHPQRYERLRRLLVIGTLARADNEAEMIFHNLARRNAINMSSLKTQSGVFYEGTGEKELVARVSALVGLVEAA